MSLGKKRAVTTQNEAKQNAANQNAANQNAANGLPPNGLPHFDKIGFTFRFLGLLLRKMTFKIGFTFMLQIPLAAFC
jgi:hypothetical protein